MTVLEFVPARWRAGGGCVSLDGGEDLAQKPHFPFFILHLSTLRPKRMTWHRKHFCLEVQQLKMGSCDKGLCGAKSKMESLVDGLFPRTITLPAVPNRRVPEISARERRSAQTGG